jgi:hypothetical protein
MKMTVRIFLRLAGSKAVAAMVSEWCSHSLLLVLYLTGIF